MFYQELASVARYFQEKNPDIDEILQMFCMREIAQLRFIAAYFFQFERDGRLHLHSFYGAPPEEIGLEGGLVDLSENHPYVSCIRDGRLVWIDRLQNRKNSRSGRFKSVIAWPIRSDYRVIGSFFALSETPYREDAETREAIEAFAVLIGSAIVTKLNLNQNNYRKDPVGVRKIQDGKLSERQELILKMISEGRTNGDVADILGYSESLIRQETIRIYAILKCSGRAEAAKIYRDRGNSNSVIESP